MFVTIDTNLNIYLDQLTLNMTGMERANNRNGLKPILAKI